MPELTIRFPTMRGMADVIRQAGRGTVDTTVHGIDAARQRIAERTRQRQMRRTMDAMFEENAAEVTFPESLHSHVEAAAANIRIIEGLTGVHRDTVLALVVQKLDEPWE